MYAKKQTVLQLFNPEKRATKKFLVALLFKLTFP